jgi:hypothetical protein
MQYIIEITKDKPKYRLNSGITVKSGLENGDYGCREIRRTDHATSLYPQKLALISPTSGGRSVGIVRSRTKAAESVIIVKYLLTYWVDIYLKY